MKKLQRILSLIGLIILTSQPITAFAISLEPEISNVDTITNESTNYEDSWNTDTNASENDTSYLEEDDLAFEETESEEVVISEADEEDVEEIAPKLEDDTEETNTNEKLPKTGVTDVFSQIGSFLSDTFYNIMKTFIYGGHK